MTAGGNRYGIARKIHPAAPGRVQPGAPVTGQQFVNKARLTAGLLYYAKAKSRNYIWPEPMHGFDNFGGRFGGCPVAGITAADTYTTFETGYDPNGSGGIPTADLNIPWLYDSNMTSIVVTGTVGSFYRRQIEIRASTVTMYDTVSTTNSLPSTVNPVEPMVGGCSWVRFDHGQGLRAGRFKCVIYNPTMPSSNRVAIQIQARTAGDVPLFTGPTSPTLAVYLKNLAIYESPDTLDGGE